MITARSIHLLLLQTVLFKINLSARATWLDEFRQKISTEEKTNSTPLLTDSKISHIEISSTYQKFHLLVSCLVFEDKKYIRQTLRNILFFTKPSTSVCVHFSALTIAHIKNHTDTSWWIYDMPPRYPGRVLVNPERKMTKHATGTVLRQHLSNLAFARDSDVQSSHFLLHASTSRFISPSIESYVFAHNFALIERKSWLSVDIWDLKNCLQLGLRGIVKGSAGEFMCSLTHELFTVRHTKTCPPPSSTSRRAMKTPQGCNRMLFSQHEGYFLPTKVAYDALDFFRVTPLINISNGKPSDMSLYDWLPMYEASGGQAAEEIWLQTFLGYEPASQKYYKKSNPLPPVDKVS